MAGVIAFAYWRIASGVSTVGDFMGFVTALLMAPQPIRALGNLSGKVQEGLAAAQSVALLDEKPRIVDRPDARPLAVTTGTIRFENVSFAYAEDSGTPAITHFDLEVPAAKRWRRRPLGSRASRPSSTSCRGSSTPAGRISSTARTCARSRSPRCAAPSRSSART